MNHIMTWYELADQKKNSIIIITPIAYKHAVTVIDCRRGQAPNLTTFYLLVVLRYGAAVLFRDTCEARFQHSSLTPALTALANTPAETERAHET